MKALRLPVSLLFLILSPASSVATDKGMANIVFEMWSRASIPSFDLTNASFEQGYDRLVREWAMQDIRTGFPLALSDFELDADVKEEPPRVTMSLRQVPFSDALELLCKATGRRVIPLSGPFRIQVQAPAAPSGEWYTRTYQLSPALTKKLLSDPVDKIRMSAVYERFGIHFESWMSTHLLGDRLLVLAGEEQHRQIVFINSLLESGYTITPPEKK
ncbi:hypothetical protein [Haloferula sp. BvORR071]|uniref:hypothetical protein n=1 Tax=Haloferula sp. BvORR071 TaxID=1396141 RepID=UPI00054F3F9A|nr:hypothetical protein [Haloferula sp. BvORR071]